MTREILPPIIIVLYIALLYGISWWTRRWSTRGGMAGYLLAGRGLPPIVIALMFAGLAVGGVSTVGVAQRAYTSGIAAGWYNVAWAAGAIVMGFLAAARYRSTGVSTVPELFERHYGTGGRVLGVLGQLVIQMVVTCLQYVAGGAILSSLLPWLSLEAGMLITAVVFVGITFLGGLWAAGLTNTVNVTLIYVSICLGAFLSLGKALGKTGGLEGLYAHLQQLEPPHPGMDIGSLGLPLVLAWFLVMIPTALGTQAVVQISLAARDPEAARRGFLLGGLLILPVGFISALLGVAAVVLHPGLEDTAEVLPRTVLGLHPLLAGLILAGLWAADVSTACGLLLGSATLVVGDIVKRFLAPLLTERQELLVSRAAVLSLSVISFLLALVVAEDILRALLTGLTLNAAYALIALMTLFCPRLCRRGSAVWTLGSTLAALGAWFLLPAGWRAMLFHPIYLVLPVALVSFLAVMALDRRPALAEPAARRKE